MVNNQWQWDHVCIIESSKHWVTGHSQVVGGRVKLFYNKWQSVQVGALMSVHTGLIDKFCLSQVPEESWINALFPIVYFFLRFVQLASMVTWAVGRFQLGEAENIIRGQFPAHCCGRVGSRLLFISAYIFFNFTLFLLNFLSVYYTILVKGLLWWFSVVLP